MNKEKNQNRKKLKGIKILDFLMLFGRNKIGFKFLEDKEHYTIKFLPEGIMDFHETIEGKEKKYPKKARLNVKRLAETMRETLRELPKILKEIDIDDSRYDSVEVIICPKKEAMKKAIEPIEVKRRKITIDENKFYGMVSRVRMKDLRDYDFQVAFWEKESEQHALYRINGRYFILKVDDFVKLFDEMFKNLNVQDSG